MKIALSIARINGNDLTIGVVVGVARQNVKVALDESARNRMKSSRDMVERWLSEGRLVYGLTTGFGPFSDIYVPPSRAKELQRNLVESHSSGFGEPLSRDVVRATMLCRANVLAKGVSGVRPEIVERLTAFLNEGIHPLIPSIGSVGASGDLVPLSYLAVTLSGGGLVEYKGRILQASEVLRQLGTPPLELDYREGLAVINGTSVSTAHAALLEYDVKMLLKYAEICTAMSFEALKANSDPLHEKIHQLKPYPGQLASARNLAKLVGGSRIVTRVAEEPTRLRAPIQDAYSLRCVPQILGSAREAIGFCESLIATELNSVSDNPLIVPGEEAPLHGGNFHGQPVSLALDILSLALVEMGLISERRLGRILDYRLSNGLPRFLASDEPGVRSGFMGLQYTATELAAENRIFANPASIQSIPTNADNQDIVSMSTIAARNARHVYENTKLIVSIEFLAATEGIEYRGPGNLGKGTKVAYEEIRRRIPKVEKDMSLTPRVEAISKLLSTPDLIERVERTIGRLD